MPTPADKPARRSAPWAGVRADHQERLARELGGVAGATRVVVLYRLTLDAFKRHGDTAEVSLNCLAYVTGLDRKTVSSCLADLEALGMIVKLPQTNHNGSLGTTRYRLTAGVPYGNSSPTVRERIPVQRSPSSQYSQESLITETQERPPLPPAGGDVLPSEVSALYDLYPRKAGRGQALKAITKALGRESAETLREAVTAFDAAVSQWPEEERRYIPYPATWFNGERWRDDRETWKRSDRPARAPSGPGRWAGPNLG